MSYLNDIEILEHRFCVKIILHYINLFENTKNNNKENLNNTKILNEPYSKGLITNDQFKILLEFIKKYENCDFFYEKGYSPNPLHEIIGIYFLFFKNIMNITENYLFKLKPHIMDKKILYTELLPEYVDNYIRPSFKWAWEILKKNSDEYEISKIIENPFIDELFKNKNNILKTIKKAKKRHILDEEVLLQIENLNLNSEF